MVSIALVQTLVPLAAILWLWLGRPLTAWDMALRAVAAAALTFAAAQAGIWLALPRATALLLAVALLAAMVMAYRRQAAAPARRFAEAGIGGWAGRTATLVGALAGVTLSVTAIAGQRAAHPAIDLAFPFADGRYLVVDGGSTALLNRHIGHAPPAQAHALDIVRIDALGMRTNGLALLSQPRDAAAYRITGPMVTAPCSGRVVAAMDNRPDAPLGGGGSVGALGNHVAIRCGANIVTLAGLARGSVAVAAGRMVGKGRDIGAVGSSGEGDEPHLHIHAERAPAPGMPLGRGMAVAIRFERSTPSRNTQFVIG